MADGGLADLVAPVSRRDADGASRAEPPRLGGRLVELAGWLATAQGGEAPQPLARIRVVLPGESVPPGLSELCDLVGAGLAAAKLPEGPAENLARGGVALADAEADAGTDLLVASSPYEVPNIAVSALVGLLATKDASLVTDAGLDDASWMVACAQVRDEMRRVRPVLADQLALLDALRMNETAYLAGLLLGAAARRTPVLLDGVLAAAAALIAQRASFRAVDWWLAGDLSTHPAHALALQRLSLVPLTELAGPPSATGLGLLAVPLLRAAAIT